MSKIFFRESMWEVVAGITVVVIMLIFSCCGDNSKNQNSNQNGEINNTSGLSDFELENGIGPIKKKLNLGPINPTLAAVGDTIFTSKCATCHKLDERYTGPAQRNVLQRVTPEFFMNMVLNPDENIQKHPHAQEMLIKYNMQKMTNQNVTIKDALALLEYFRVLDQELKQNKSN